MNSTLLKKIAAQDKAGADARNKPMSKQTMKNELRTSGKGLVAHPSNNNRSKAFRMIYTSLLPNRRERRLMKW